MKNSLLSSSLTNFLSFLSNAVITFVLTPVYISALGRYDFGLWEMVSVFIGYASLLDLGIKGALVRQTAYQLKHDGASSVSSLYSSALLYMGSIGALLSIILVSILEFSPNLLFEQANENTDYVMFFNVIAGIVFLTFIRNAAEGVLQGRQMYAIKNILDIAIRSAVAVAIYHYLTESNGLDFMVKVYLVAAIFAIISYNLLLLLVSPSVHPFVSPSLAQFKELVSFGVKSLVGGTADYIKRSTATLVIGLTMGPAHVVLYSIPNALIQYIETLVNVVTNALLPRFTDVVEDDSQLKSFFFLTSNLNIWVVWTASVFMVFFGADFMTIWLGPEQIEVINQEIIALICIALLIYNLNPIGLIVAYAKNKHGFYAKWNPVAAIVTIILSLWAVKLYGVKGAAMALILSNAIFIPLFFKYTNKILKVKTKAFLVNVIFENIVVISFVILLTILYKNSIYNDAAESYLDILEAGAFISFSALVLKFISIKLYRPIWFTEIKRLNKDSEAAH